ncbi:hypothetical protein ABHN07_10930, partial [Priestia megaterium]
RMTGNLSCTVLRGSGARVSACLPDLTKYVYHIQLKKQKKLPAIWGVFSATFILLKDLKVTAY